MAKIGITKNNPKDMIEIITKDSYFIFTDKKVSENCTRPKHKIVLDKG